MYQTSGTGRRSRRRVLLGTLCAAVATAGIVVVSPAAGHADPTLFRGEGLLTFVPSNMALDVSGSSLNDGAQLVQRPRSGGADQRWSVVSPSNDPGYAYVRNARSARCLNLPGGSTTPGATLDQRACSGADS